MSRPPCSIDEFSLPREEGLIVYENGVLRVPDNPAVAVIKGDGIGPEVVESSMKVVDEAVFLAYGGSRRIYWVELTAGRSSLDICGSPLPEVTVEALKMVRAALKGPLETPAGSGYRSVNVFLRRVLDLYANIRPVKWYGQPTPYKYPEKVNVTIFRENTEDLYAGIEWPYDSVEAAELRRFLWDRYGVKLEEDTGIGVKPISRHATHRIVRLALTWARERRYKRVTIAHKGTVMKYTEGAFARWAYELALKEFRDYVVTEEELESIYGGEIPEGKILVNDRLSDNMLQQLILRPWDYDIIVCPNVIGDLISEVAASLVGGIGIAPGLNIGDGIAMAEPAHGTAPKLAGKDLANPTAAILSGALLLREFLGWFKAANIIESAVRDAISQGLITVDLAMGMARGGFLRTSEYRDVLIDIMRSKAR